MHPKPPSLSLGIRTGVACHLGVNADLAALVLNL